MDIYNIYPFCKDYIIFSLQFTFYKNNLERKFYKKYMNQLVEYNNLNKCIKKGEKKLENNDFFQDLCGLMENDEFKNFFNKHMSNWTEIKCSLIYMHLYNQFKSKYKELNDEELDKNLIVYLLSKIMCDQKLRPWSISTIDKTLKSNKVKFFDEFEAFMVANKDLKLLT